MEGVPVGMSIKVQTPEELEALDTFNVDEQHPHIVIDKDICAKCEDKPCLVICPAVLFRLKDGEMTYDYAGCLECGTCRVMCSNEGIVKWSYPEGGFGVVYRFG
jgi:ferredoxin like protein